MQIAICGGERADGDVSIQGSKNAALPMLAASILTEDEMVFHRCPQIYDVEWMLALLRHLGVKATWESDTLTVQANHLQSHDILQKEAGRLRASILFLGSLLARTGSAKVHMPGGCSIGKRPIDIHMDALEKSGVQVSDREEWLVCESGSKPETVEIHFPYPSVGATENLILYHVLGKGKARLKNTAREPEINSLCEMLRQMGAKISGEKTGNIYIEGVKKLHGIHTKIPADRIAFMTYAAMALGTQGKICLRTGGESFEPEQRYLEKAGCHFVAGTNEIIAEGTRGICPISFLKTQPYPGFPTDAQSIFLSLLSRAHGESVLCETVFENRFQMIPYLKKMGADIERMEQCAHIRGVTRLHGETVVATDLRSGAALLLAGAMAEGKTCVEKAENILRGYVEPVEQMKKMGLRVQWEEEES